MAILRRVAVAGILALVLATPARAWDNGGHLLIADVATQHLNPTAWTELERLAAQLPHSGASYNFITISYWMDDIRFDKAVPDYGMFKSWHYIDLGIAPGDPMPSLEPGDDNDERGNVVQALKRAVVVLKGGTDPYIKDKATACAIVMHLVGDIHQPLHCASKYFLSHDKLLNDKGGNDEFIVNGANPGAALNLHFFWDRAYEAAFDETTGNVIFEQRWVDSFREALPYNPDPKASLEPDFDAWAKESNALSLFIVISPRPATKSIAVSAAPTSRKRDRSRNANCFSPVGALPRCSTKPSARLNPWRLRLPIRQVLPRFTTDVLASSHAREPSTVEADRDEEPTRG